jgi:hypothetical protein
MRESRTYGSERGVRGNSDPYRDRVFGREQSLQLARSRPSAERPPAGVGPRRDKRRASTTN